MLQRRLLLSGLASLVASRALAQRPAHPIARPPRPANLPRMPGRFNLLDGVPGGALPGIYTVVAVDQDDETLQLRDQDGRTGLVHVDGDMFDFDEVKAGDEVEVDFKVQEPGVKRFEAGGIWKVQR